MKKTWTFLLKMVGEVPAIVLAVFLALVVNDCNENRKDRRLAAKSLEALHAELLQNRYALEKNTTANEEEAAGMLIDLDSLKQLGIEKMKGVSVGLSQAVIHDSAWQMAILNGSTRHFDSDLLVHLTTIYGLQELYGEMSVNYFKELSSADFYRPNIDKERLQASLQVHKVTHDIAKQLARLYEEALPLLEAQK